MRSEDKIQFIFQKRLCPSLRIGWVVLLVLHLWSPLSLWSADTNTAAAAKASESPAILPASNLIHFGFSSRILVGINENDANAALKTWIRLIAQESNTKADPNPEIFHNPAAIAESLRQKKVESVTMTIDEYWAIRNEVKLGRMVCSTLRQGQVTEEYLLLVRKDAPIQTLGDLKGRSLLVFENPNMSLASIWLDTQLMERGFKAAPEHCGRITGNTRLANVVLPVFFRQTDACLVTRAGFETLGELNPQVTQQIRVLLASVPLLYNAFFFRADCPPQEVENMIKQLSRIHTTSAGQQVLTVFQTDHISEQQPDQLNSALELLAKHEALCKANVKTGAAK